jgi:hypothetical protein
VTHFNQQVTEDPSDAEHLSGIFGIPFHRPPYVVRSRPDAPRAATVVLPSLQLVDTVLEKQRVLPSLQQVDAVLTKKTDGLQLSPDELTTLALISATGHGERRLLGRKAIAALFGIDEWSYLDHWQKKMPCAGLINAETGIPAAHGHPEAVECGCDCWCPNCSEFYHCMLSCPNPHLVQQEVKHLLKSGLFTSDADLVKAPIAISDLPVHVCSQPCSGLVA